MTDSTNLDEQTLALASLAWHHGTVANGTMVAPGNPAGSALHPVSQDPGISRFDS